MYSLALSQARRGPHRIKRLSRVELYKYTVLDIDTYIDIDVYSLALSQAQSSPHRIGCLSRVEPQRYTQIQIQIQTQMYLQRYTQIQIQIQTYIQSRTLASAEQSASHRVSFPSRAAAATAGGSGTLRRRARRCRASCRRQQLCPFHVKDGELIIFY